MLNIDYPGRKLTEAEKTLNERVLNEAAEVGLFFADTKSNKLYGDSIKLRDAVRMTDEYDKSLFILAHPNIHWDVWDRVRFENSNWEKMSRSAWDVPPRGRVTLEYSPKDKRNMFYVYADPRLNTQHWKDSIESYFELPSDQTIYRFTRKI